MRSAHDSSAMKDRHRHCVRRARADTRRRVRYSGKAGRVAGCSCGDVKAFGLRFQLCVQGCCMSKLLLKMNLLSICSTSECCRQMSVVIGNIEIKLPVAVHTLQANGWRE